MNTPSPCECSIDGFFGTKFCRITLKHSVRPETRIEGGSSISDETTSNYADRFVTIFKQMEARAG